MDSDAPKPKKKVSAKAFLNDLRSGKTEQELMFLHDLDGRTMERLLDVLVNKKLLSQEEVQDWKDTTMVFSERSTDRIFQVPRPETFAPTQVLNPTFPEPRAQPKPEVVEGPKCPQCDALVPTKALACPECGHLLPGEDRWAMLEPEKGLLERIPPLILGTILSVPVAIAIFVLFYYFVLPAREHEVKQHISQIKSQKDSGSKGPGIVHVEARLAAIRSLRLMVRTMVSQGIFIAVDPKYQVFLAGKSWHSANQDTRIKWLTQISRALETAGMDVDFEVVDDDNRVLSTVYGPDMEFFKADEPQPGPQNLNKAFPIGRQAPDERSPHSGEGSR